MIEVQVGDVAAVAAEAVLRPVGADGGAVTPAMRRLEQRAGPSLADHWRRVGELPVGSAVITPAAELDAAFMVHAVIRSREEPVTPAGVRRGLVNGLRRLAEWEIETVALPPLGTGAGNLTSEEAAEIMADVLDEHLRLSEHPRRVVVVVDNDYERAVFRQRLARVSAPANPRGLPRLE